MTEVMQFFCVTSMHFATPLGPRLPRSSTPLAIVSSPTNVPFPGPPHSAPPPPVTTVCVGRLVLGPPPSLGPQCDTRDLDGRGRAGGRSPPRCPVPNRHQRPPPDHLHRLCPPRRAPPPGGGPVRLREGAVRAAGRGEHQRVVVAAQRCERRLMGRLVGVGSRPQVGSPGSHCVVCWGISPTLRSFASIHKEMDLPLPNIIVCGGVSGCG